MPRSEEVARYETVRASAGWVSQWWEAERALPMLEALFARMKAAGRGARLVAERGTRDDGAEVLWLSVAGGDGPQTEDHDGFNYSHPCPPFC